MNHVCTDENLVDPLMKGLTRENFHNTSKKMGLIPIDKWVSHGKLALNTEDHMNSV